MCFSATASFVASGGLALVGAASLKVAPKKKRILALIPLLFAFQQALEGIQWVALGGGTVCRSAGYGFMVIALIMWPILIPIAVYLCDHAGRRRVRWFVLLGIGVAIVHTYALIMQPLGMSIIGRHIVYGLTIPLDGPMMLLYVAAVVGPLWASSMLTFRRYGVIVFAAGLAAIATQWLAFASVWCFFAALTSALIYFFLRRRK